MNIVVLKGNLARDPDVREVSVGGRTTKVVNFTVAVSRFYRKQNGERDKDTVFILCEAWDTGADRISAILKKGDPVLVEGSLKTENWEKDGQKHSRMKVRVSTFDKLNRSQNPRAEADANDATDDVTDDANATPEVANAGANTSADIPF